METLKKNNLANNKFFYRGEMFKQYFILEGERILIYPQSFFLLMTQNDMAEPRSIQLKCP